MANSELLSVVIYTLFSTLLLATSLGTFINLSFIEYKEIYALGVNWNRGTLNTIYYESNRSKCSKNENSLITNSWAGTVTGCYCNPYDQNFGPLRRGSCSAIISDKWYFWYSCKDVNATTPIKYTKWRNNNICGTRSSNTYFDLTIVPSSSNCPYDTKSCGKIDSMDNLLCVSYFSNCPINQITINKHNKPNPSQTSEIEILLKGNSTYISTPHNLLIITSIENTNGTIPIEFIISDNLPCADSDNVNYYTTPYILDPYFENNKFICKTKIGDSKFNQRYKLIDSYDYNYVLMENNIMDTLNKLPFYNFNYNYHTVNLYQSGYVGLKPLCHADLKIKNSNLVDDFLNIEDTINTFWIISLAVTVVSAVLTFLVVVYVFVLFVFNSEEIDEYEFGLHHKKICFNMLFSYTLVIAEFVLTFLLIINLLDTKLNFDFLQDKNCVDQITFQASYNFSYNITLSVWMTLGGIISSFVLLSNSYYQLKSCCRG